MKKLLAIILVILTTAQATEQHEEHNQQHHKKEQQGFFVSASTLSHLTELNLLFFRARGVSEVWSRIHQLQVKLLMETKQV